MTEELYLRDIVDIKETKCKEGSKHYGPVPQGYINPREAKNKAYFILPFRIFRILILISSIGYIQQIVRHT